MLTAPRRNTDTPYLTMHSSSTEDLSPGARASKNRQFGFTILLEKSFLLSPNPWKFLVTKLRKPMRHRHHCDHGNHHAHTKPIDIRYHFIHFVIYNGSLRHRRLARFLTSSGSIPNEGGVHSKWLPSANLRAAIRKKIILSKDILVDRSNSSPTRRHVWISPAECEPLWFFLVSSCDARELKVCDFEMDRGSRLLDHGVCKHQHTLRDVAQPRHREDIINELVSTASGQFIYTFHCAQVYDDQNGHPEELLDTFVRIHTLSCNHQQAFSPSS